MPRRRQTRRNRGAPTLALIEDVAIAVNDTVSSTLIAGNVESTSTSLAPIRFHLNKAVWAVTSGDARTRVLCIIRKVPAGYSPPAITVASSITAIQGSGVLAYGLINTTVSTLESSSDEVPLMVTARDTTLMAGDTVYVQIVSNIASTGQTAFAAVHYSISSV